MTDIIDLFLDVENIEKMNKRFGVKGPCPSSDPRDCGMRVYMHEFIYGPYMAGLYDVWTGTDADLYLNHMNDEFIKYMEIRYSRKMHTPRVIMEAPSARVETASYLDPFDRREEQRRRIEMAQSRRPITRGTGASMGGASARSFVRIPRGEPPPMGALMPRNCNPATLAFPCSLRPEAGLSCKCRGGISGAHAVTCPRHPRARQRGPEMRPGFQADMYYARQNSDIASSVHLASRDDEASDVGHLGHTQYFATAPDRAALPYDFSESQPWRTDPTAGSGEAQHHLLVLDSQLAVLNEERTIPYGYGSTEDQLADDARVAARYRCRIPEVGVIPKTSYKKLIRVQAPTGRVTLDDDRIMARDIFARDSKGFILSGRHTTSMMQR